MSPNLSIIVPIYKIEQYIKECIDSILAQTYKDFELILVNDGSPDSCPEICDTYAQIDSRIKVIHKENGGLVSARKAGFEQAKGKYIGFVDGDDFIDPTMYEKMFMSAEKYKTDIVICLINYHYGEKNVPFQEQLPSGYYDSERLVKEFYPYMLYSGKFFHFGISPAVWCKIFKRDFLQENFKYVDNILRMGEDSALSFPCFLDAKSVYVLDEHLYFYRQSLSSMTKNYDALFFDRIKKLYDGLLKANNDKKTYDISRQINFYLIYILDHGLMSEMSGKNKCSIIKKSQNIRIMLNDSCVILALQDIYHDSSNLKSKILFFLIKNKLVFLLMFFIQIRRFVSIIGKRG